MVAIGGSSDNNYLDPRGRGRARSVVVSYWHVCGIAMVCLLRWSQLRNGVTMVTMMGDGWSDLVIFYGIIPT